MVRAEFAAVAGITFGQSILENLLENLDVATGFLVGKRNAHQSLSIDPNIGSGKGSSCCSRQESHAAPSLLNRELLLCACYRSLPHWVADVQRDLAPRRRSPDVLIQLNQ